MTAREYLLQIYILDRTINDKLDKIYLLKTTFYSTSGLSENERVQMSSDKDRTGNAVARIVDLEREVEGLVDRYVDLKKQVILYISQLKKQKHQFILTKRYIYYKSMRDIADELGMSERGCKKAHKKALEEISIIIKQYIVF